VNKNVQPGYRRGEHDDRIVLTRRQEAEMNFPRFIPTDNQAELEEFYSKHKLGTSGKPTAVWESENLTLIKPAYPLTPAFEPKTQVTRIRCHQQVADSLLRVFEMILKHFGSVEEVRKARMHLFAGCYNFRAIKDSNRLSAHSSG
jgi:hypothetical protein